jgi:hypothetical protein
VKPEHVVGIALRLFAILLSLSIVSHFSGSAWYYIISGSNAGYSLLVILFTILLAVLAFLLWRFPFWIASKLLKFDDSMNRPSSWGSLDEVQTVAFTVMGVYFLFQAITETIYWLALFTTGFSIAPEPQQRASMLMTIAEFLLACFLIFGARGLGQLISRLRRIGTD